MKQHVYFRDHDQLQEIIIKTLPCERPVISLLIWACKAQQLCWEESGGGGAVKNDDGGDVAGVGRESRESRQGGLPLLIELLLDDAVR